ncbi:hypothetical protein PENSPDRAFT_735154 [Peniophora sp. CONT]|nr:hypothetical protein PENSPDRAFT_735154 [Peniophora sp. CONT]
MSSKICAFWLKGQCTFGTSCRNKHGDQEQVVRPNVSAAATTTCPHFMRGSCKFGDQCHFPHLLATSSTPGTPYLQRSPQLDKLLDSKTPHSSTTSWRARPGKAPPSIVSFGSPGLASGSSVPVCSHFLSGGCRFGDQCRLSHEMKMVAPALAFTGTFGACKFFQYGSCFKPDCPFPHVKQTAAVLFTSPRPPKSPTFNPPAELARSETSSQLGTQDNVAEPLKGIMDQNNVSDTPDIEKDMMGCKISCGPGAVVLFLKTAFESGVLLISGIPADASQETLLTLLETFGDIRIFSREPGSASARVEFYNSRQAASAIGGLLDSQVGSRSVTLSAKFELGAVQVGVATLRSTKVKLSFFAPSFLGYAHYTSVTKARQEAKRLDAMVFEGTTIRAEFQTPSYRQKTSFSVVLKGLPSRLRSGDVALRRRLMTFTHASSITIGHPTYHLSEDAIASIRACLERYGRLESFDLAPQRGTKIAAWAQFASSDSASQATVELHGKPLRCLGKSPVWVEQVHALRFTLPSAQFIVLKDELDRLSATLDVASKLRYYEYDQDGAVADPVVLRLYSSMVWDDMFAAEEGRALANEVHAVSSVYVECNTRSRFLRLHGQPSARAQARAMLLQALRDAHERRHIIPIERTLLRSLLSGGFKDLQREAKDHEIQLDIVRRTITVRGDATAVEFVRRTLGRLASGQAIPSSAANGNTASGCPICFCEVEAQPVTLSCGHVYDTDCLRLLAQSSGSSSDFKPLLCVAEGESSDEPQPCATAISLAQIRELLGPEEESRLLEASARAHINAHPDEFHYCPTPDCAVVYRPARAGTVIRCSSCLVLICAHCHVEEHVGLSCEGHKDSMRPHAELFTRWKAENGVKSCPKCSADIQKNGGCNHITCAGCKIHICWVCMATFGDQDTSGGVYAPMRRAHGGYSGVMSVSLVGRQDHGGANQWQKSSDVDRSRRGHGSDFRRSFSGRVCFDFQPTTMVAVFKSTHSGISLKEISREEDPASFFRAQAIPEVPPFPISYVV